MWGNSTGWIISGFIAVAMLGLLYYAAAPPARTAPTGSPKLNVANVEVALPVAPATIVAPGTKDCDAGDLYRKAIEDFQLTPDIYEKFQTGGQMKIKESELSAVGDILAARDCRNCSLFSRNLTQVVNYENTEPVLVALKTSGEICCTLGLLYTNTKYNPILQPEKAVKLWEAAFMLGWHLYDERASYTEMADGLGLMSSAAAGLENYYKEKKDIANAEKMEAFLGAGQDYQQKLTGAWQIIGSVDESYAGGYAGDIFRIAENPSADRAFRAEALKHIGHYRYNARTTGDQLAARKVIRKMMEDDKLPPNVKAAATAAHDLTLEKHNMVGGAS